MESFAFQWHITDACDQRCKHCYIFAEQTDKTPVAMKFADMQKVLANILSFCRTFRRQPYLYLTGGDPILHLNFWKLIELLKQKQIPFGLMGNPFHLTQANLRRLKACGCLKYQMSLDGMEQTHDWLRKPGSFRETLAKIPMIHEAGILSVIMTTVSSFNYRELPQIIDTVVQAQAGLFAFARYVPTSKEKTTGIPPETYRELLAICDAKIQTHRQQNCYTKFCYKDHLWTLYHYETGQWKLPPGTEKGVTYDGCHCGDCHLTILPSGDVYACRRAAESKVGNALQDPLTDLWLKPMEAYRDYTKFRKCSRCRLLAFCRGCPAVAKETYGSFYAEDPQCWASETNDMLTLP